jgi:Zn-finger nucleic acid-binding protein
MANVTNCPNCGAPMQSDKNSGALVCTHCGTLEVQPILVRDIEVGPTSRQPCPLCATPLSHAHLDGNALLYCQSCMGMLIAIDVFVLVIEAARSREERSGVSLPRRQNPGDRTLACPGCGQAMLSHFYGGPGNLVIDTCERCCVNWLDPGELRRIARAPQGRVWLPPPPLERPDPGDENDEDA